jgi:hypothetical protein
MTKVSTLSIKKTLIKHLEGIDAFLPFSVPGASTIKVSPPVIVAVT